MSQVAIPINQATSSLPLLIKRAACGEEIFIGDNGLAEVRLTAAKPTSCGIKLGLLEGKYIVPDDFDAPLPPDVLAGFGYTDEISS